MTLTGRIKELINRGGEKISPIEVALLSLHPADSCPCVTASNPPGLQHEWISANVTTKETHDVCIYCAALTTPISSSMKSHAWCHSLSLPCRQVNCGVGPAHAPGVATTHVTSSAYQLACLGRPASVTSASSKAAAALNTIQGLSRTEQLFPSL